MPCDIAMATEVYNTSEEDLIKLLEKHKNEKITLEDGLVLRIGESIDLPVVEGWTSYNENVVEIVNGELIAKSVGSTFISRQTNDNIYILEVSISDAGITSINSSRAITRNVNRSYYKVFIDPGHGGYDNGAVQNGVFEDEINLIISKKVESKLIAKGVDVKMSRYDDTYLSLTQRSRMANDYGSDIFVSIHQNSATNSTANGIETFYATSSIKGRELATDIQEDLIQFTNANNRGVKEGKYTVIQTTQMPASLVECGFISNVDEAKKLSSSSYQDKVADAIVSGIMEYLEENVILNSGNGDTAAPSTGASVQTGTVKVGSELNVRSGAGTNYGTIGSLKNGSTVEIVETSGNWYKIKYGSGYGFVSKDYVVINNISRVAQIDIKQATVVTSVLRIREEENYSSNILGVVSMGEKVSVLEKGTEWSKITYNKTEGYILNEYVDFNIF